MNNTDSSNRVISSTAFLPALSSQFSPGTAYYLRRLLRKNLDRLITADAGPFDVSWLNDLEALVKTSPDTSIETTLQAIDQLVQQHQLLSNQGFDPHRDLSATEQQIVSLLGLSLKKLNQQATLLIVDDTPDNLRLLSTMLGEHGYTVRSAINGALAINSAQIIKPDLILLDIMMPGLDGYEVCKRLKADPKTSDIPVVFMIGADEAIDRAKAFGVGGIDYITKPVQIEEVLARIQHQIKIWNLQKRLEEQSLRLQEEIRQRQQTDERSHQLFEKAVSGVYRLGSDGKFLAVNNAMAQLYGYESPEDMTATATAPTLYTNPHRFGEFISQMQIANMITGFESEIRRPDKTLLWVTETARAVRDDLRNLLYYEGTVTDISTYKKAEIRSHRSLRHTQQILLSLFPKPVARQVSKQPDWAVSEHFAAATVLFADVVGMTTLARDLHAADFLRLLNQIFASFNNLAETFQVEPVKTIGTRYLAISGVPKPTPNHAIAMAEFALEIQDAMLRHGSVNNQPLKLRMGIHSGPVIAGVTGPKRLSYDVWGDTIRIADWLEHKGTPGKIQLSSTTYELLKFRYTCEPSPHINSLEGSGTPIYWLLSG